MGKVCFDCGMKGKTWTGPVFSSADKLREFYRKLDVSDPIIEKMQDGDLLCSKCTGKAECRHALKCYNYYKEKWTSEQYEIWAKNNANLISIAETELKEQEKTDFASPEITTTSSIPYETKTKVEKLAVIKGNPIQNGQPDSTGQAIINSELTSKFEAFCSSSNTMRIKISRGFMLIIIGIILYFPVAKGFQIILPPTYGLIFTLLLGPGFLIAGTILVIRDIKSAKVKKEIVSDQSKFCGKCGKEASREDIFCTNCGTESKKS